MSAVQLLARFVSQVIRVVDLGQSGLALVFRFAMANVFWAAGMSKIASWSTTLDLFAYEYAVPLIPSVPAAYLATGAELLFPVMLVLGLGTRFAAAGLFILNYVAAISYPDISAAGINDHYFWGAVLLALFFYGPGRVSLDVFLAGKFAK